MPVNGGVAWISSVMILTAAALGAVSVILLADTHALTEAFAQNASGYGGVFTRSYDLKNAFSCAVSLSRADIALFFLILLFPYTAMSRPLTVGVSFLRAALSALAISASVASPLAVASLAVTLAAAFPGLYRSDSLYARNSRSNGMAKISLRDTYISVKTAMICSGSAIAARMLLLLIGSLYYT